MKMNGHKVYTCADAAEKHNTTLDEFKRKFAEHITSYVNDAILNNWEEVVRFEESDTGYYAAISFICK